MGRVWVVPVLENMAQLSVAGDLVMFLVLLVFFFGGGLWTTSRAGCSPLLNCIPQGFRQWMGTSSSTEHSAVVRTRARIMLGRGAEPRRAADWGCSLCFAALPGAGLWLLLAGCGVNGPKQALRHGELSARLSGDARRGRPCWGLHKPRGQWTARSLTPQPRHMGQGLTHVHSGQRDACSNSSPKFDQRRAQRRLSGALYPKS